MTLSTVVLPLRLSKANLDLSGMLASYLDSNSSSLGIRSMDCRGDLQRMNQLRQSICSQIGEPDAYTEGIQALDEMHEYYNCLLECEAKGIVGERGDGQSSHSPTTLALEWESALSGEMQILGTLEWERANLVWNFATLEAYQASNQILTATSKDGWSKAANHFQQAASWLRHVPQSVDHVLDFSNVFLDLWQSLLMALSQRCGYDSTACGPRPRHLLCAKLAAGAIPLYAAVENIVKNDEESERPILIQFANVTNHWAYYAHAWELYMKCKAEHHQSCLSKEKKQWGQEIARLDVAIRFASQCQDFCERFPIEPLKPLRKAVKAAVQEIGERLPVAEQHNAQMHGQAIPLPIELADIRGQNLVKIDQPLSKLLKPMQGGPMFEQVEDTQHLQAYVEMFHSEMEQRFQEVAELSEERTEAGRKALSTVNLPHSLTAYHQEQSGGGIPEDLWRRVHAIQRENRVANLKRDLWELRDVAEMARTTYQKINSQLQTDLEADDLFRKENPGFEGYKVLEVQKPLRHSLAGYERLLKTAQEGDTVLLRRLEILDTNPKYKLLQFQKSQLDRLVPAGGGGGGAGGGRNMIDTTPLSGMLVELSGLFKDREHLLACFRQSIDKYDIEYLLQSKTSTNSGPNNNNDQHYRQLVQYAQKSFDGMIYDLRSNFEAQTEMIDAILAENETFMVARERCSNSQTADSCIVMIEDAIEEIDQLGKHLKEGKDFYDVVIPKLEKLKHQVGDISARLTVERLEYDDKANRNRQEEEDAEMAKRMSDSTAPSSSNNDNDGNKSRNTTSTSNGNGNGHASPPRNRRVSLVNHHTDPQVFVDDEKVATLIAMDFDPAKVVAALAKYNNNVDQALNDLLSC